LIGKSERGWMLYVTRIGTLPDVTGFGLKTTLSTVRRSPAGPTSFTLTAAAEERIGPAEFEGVLPVFLLDDAAHYVVERMTANGPMLADADACSRASTAWHDRHSTAASWSSRACICTPAPSTRLSAGWSMSRK
jgi:hypothetical protein